MNEVRSAYLAVLLLSVLLVEQTVVAQTDEYEYYYEEVNASSTTLASSPQAIETTTVTLVPAVEGSTEPSPTPVILELENTETPTDLSALVTGEESTEDVLKRNNWSTAAINDNKPVTTTDVRPTDQILTLLNGTRPTKYNASVYKSNNRPKADTQPGIVLNIYTGMYGMQSRAKNRLSSNVGGRNNVWPRAQPSLQGWYGMYNRNQMQSYMPRQQAPPVYRGRGPQNYYDNGYNQFTYHTATKPRRNNQQTRGTALDQQASLAVFNFLLQALGQRAGSATRSQSQVQQGSRRRQ